MMKNFTIFLFVILYLIPQVLISENRIEIIEKKGVDEETLKSIFLFSENSNLEIINQDWTIFPSGDTVSKIKVNLPAVFNTEEKFVYSKRFIVSKNDTIQNKIFLCITSLNSFADILLNDITIHKHIGAGIPIKVELPKDIVIFNQENKLDIIVSNKLDSRNTIPLKQRFLFPNSPGGINGDVFLLSEAKETLSIKKLSIIKNNGNNFHFIASIKGSSDLNRVKFSFYAKNDPLVFEELLINFNTQVVDTVIKLKTNQDIYNVRVEHFSNDIYSDSWNYNNIIALDEQFNLKNLKAVHYSLSENVSIDVIKKDIELIKGLGINIVRFSNSLPDISLVSELKNSGFKIFVDIPISSIPINFTEDKNFNERVYNYLINMIEFYEKFDLVIAYGLGSGYLGNNAQHRKFLTNISDLTKKSTNIKLYASFSEYPIDDISSLDYIGYEIYSPNRFKNLDDISVFRDKDFISELKYPAYRGSSSGYLNEYSYEAQAKFYENNIKVFQEKKIGFVFGEIADYQGAYASLTNGYSENNLYNLGLVGKDRNSNRLSYKVIKAKLNNLDRVNVPVGVKADESPIFYVLVGLGIALLMALLVNSNRKFREDATRALLRPYNFFADIRDHRIFSTIQSNILFLVIAGTLALIFSGLLNFQKDNYLLERILLATGNDEIITLFTFLCREPITSFFYLFFFFIALLFIITIIIKLYSAFLKNRVLISDIYYTAIWAFLPIVILLPLGLILDRVLTADIANNYVYLFLLLFMFLMFQRLLKGVYVIFDVNPSVVYLYGFFSISIFVASILLYLHFTESFFDHLSVLQIQKVIFR